MTNLMRVSTFLLVFATGSAAAAEPKELVTAPDAVLCLDAGSLGQAAAGEAAKKNQERLRSLGCLRSPAGVPATLLSQSDEIGIWSVRFRPQGISGGITLWGRPSAFTLPDGSPLRSQRAEK
jgi:hypothetical protein